MENLLIKDWIYRYFQLYRTIENVDSRKAVLREFFYAQTMQVYTTIDNLGLKVSSFRMETEIPCMLDTLIKMDRYKARLKARLKYFNRFLETLSDAERVELVKEYDSLYYQKYPVSILDRTTYNEIIQIEEAIAWMYGYPPETQEEINETTRISHLRRDFEDMLERLGI
ncbi:hypothetical protein HCA15_03690 [Listeria booriae]|uniref:hypothetical protein n=1 Tax=Listeria booriae TaxID=1552123 RepID=UPI00164CE16E|nr:hypothetical protein [Listeria booriae]MBC6165739.1 hypothetical protein [Listeria booriae]